VPISTKIMCSQFRKSLFLLFSILLSWFLTFLFSLLPSLSAYASFFCPMLSFPLWFGLAIGTLQVFPWKIGLEESTRSHINENTYKEENLQVGYVKNGNSIILYKQKKYPDQGHNIPLRTSNRPSSPPRNHTGSCTSQSHPWPQIVPNPLVQPHCQSSPLKLNSIMANMYWTNRNLAITWNISTTSRMCEYPPLRLRWWLW